MSLINNSIDPIREYITHTSNKVGSTRDTSELKLGSDFEKHRDIPMVFVFSQTV